MSKHWNPNESVAQLRPSESGNRLRSLDEFVPRDEPEVVELKKRWPEGATAGLVLVAAMCLGVAVGFYWAAGPRDVFGP
jgi:hypothetical protein